MLEGKSGLLSLSNPPVGMSLNVPGQLLQSNAELFKSHDLK